ncbi:MAG: VWA domain-containing protein [Chitinophagales bacterium]|nr:VWA domain-containing protein [Chitinophagales bacterium]
MLKFGHSAYFVLLLIIPILILIYFVSIKQKDKLLNIFGDNKFVAKMFNGKNNKRTIIKFTLLIVAIAFIILALTSPQMGTKEEKVQRKGIDVVICLDLSKSMLAEDVLPNRLRKAKLLMQEMLSKLDGDRVGLVVFAGNAYLQMPLTVDYSSLLLYLRALNTNAIPTQGTALGEALEEAEKAFNTKDDKYKSIILISDGEDHQQDAIDYAKDVSKKGTKIITVGVGTTQGGTIPFYNQNEVKIGEKKDANGEVVVSKLNEKMLKELADAGKGHYYILDNANQVADFISKDIAKMETKTINDKVFTNFVEQYQYFLAFGLLLIFVDVFIKYKKD